MTATEHAAIVVELTQLHEAYERALTANDAAALTQFFASEADTIRYGVNEELYGPEAIAAYRQGNNPPAMQRPVRRREVIVKDLSHAIIMAEIDQIPASGDIRHIRQTQVWHLAENGWRIVAAHVSLRPAPAPADKWGAYTDATAAALDLKIPPEYRAEVVRNVTITARLAASLLAFPLPASAELGSVFTP